MNNNTQQLPLRKQQYNSSTRRAAQEECQSAVDRDAVGMSAESVYFAKPTFKSVSNQPHFSQRTNASKVGMRPSCALQATSAASQMVSGQFLKAPRPGTGRLVRPAAKSSGNSKKCVQTSSNQVATAVTRRTMPTEAGSSQITRHSNPMQAFVKSDLENAFCKKLRRLTSLGTSQQAVVQDQIGVGLLEGAVAPMNKNKSALGRPAKQFENQMTRTMDESMTTALQNQAAHRYAAKTSQTRVKTALNQRQAQDNLSKAQKKSKARHERGCSIQSAILSPLPTKYQKIGMCDGVLEPLSVNDMYNACQKTTTVIDNKSSEIGSGLASFIQTKQETPQCPQLERKSRRQQAFAADADSPKTYPSDQDVKGEDNEATQIKPAIKSFEHAMSEDSLDDQDENDQHTSNKKKKCSRLTFLKKKDLSGSVQHSSSAKKNVLSPVFPKREPSVDSETEVSDFYHGRRMIKQTTSDTPFEMADALANVLPVLRKQSTVRVASERISNATTQAGSNPSAQPQLGIRVRRKTDKENMKPQDSSHPSLRSSELDLISEEPQIKFQKSFSSNLQAKQAKLLGISLVQTQNVPEGIKPLIKSKTIVNQDHSMKFDQFEAVNSTTKFLEVGQGLTKKLALQSQVKSNSFIDGLFGQAVDKENDVSTDSQMDQLTPQKSKLKRVKSMNSDSKVFRESLMSDEKLRDSNIELEVEEKVKIQSRATQDRFIPKRRRSVDVDAINSASMLCNIEHELLLKHHRERMGIKEIDIRIQEIQQELRPNAQRPLAQQSRQIDQHGFVAGQTEMQTLEDARQQLMQANEVTTLQQGDSPPRTSITSIIGQSSNQDEDNAEVSNMSSAFNLAINEQTSLRLQSQQSSNSGSMRQRQQAQDVHAQQQLNQATPSYSSIFGVNSSYSQSITQQADNMRTSLTVNTQSSQSNVVLDSTGISLPRSRFVPGIQTQSGYALGSYEMCSQEDIENTMQGKNQAQDEKNNELKRNIANYNNMIEQNLFLEPGSASSIGSSTSIDSCSMIDTSAASNIFMSNLSTPDCAQENQDSLNEPRGNKQCKNTNFSQKSILAGRVLKLTEVPIEEKVKDLSMDFNRFGLVNHDDLFVSSSMSSPIVSDYESKPTRKIPPNPYRVLDAPCLQDDFYLNLVDWSAQNILAVALENQVYVWNATTSTVAELCDLGGHGDQVTSLSWSKTGNHLSVGTKSGQVQIWDVNHKRKIRDLNGHADRVSSLAWNNVTTSVVASGSKDRKILVRDLRASTHSYMCLHEHRQEVCGLRWSVHDENQLASGGNDNQLFIWSPTRTQPLAKFSEHQAAVKAINWSPLHRGLLATGGGTADQCIRFWNTTSLTPLNAINTGSQVCNLVFSKTNDELVSTHGYSLNQVIVWKYPTMEKLATLTGHTFRVLYLAMNPDGSQIVTGAGDERLRFWNVFPKARSSRVGPLGGLNILGSGSSSLFPSNLDIR